jgi:Ankyrin repeats (3 copies)
VRMLLLTGADIDDDSYDRRTALSFAAKAGAPGAVQMLLEHNTAYRRDCMGSSVLLCADEWAFKYIGAVNSLLRKPLFES